MAGMKRYEPGANKILGQIHKSHQEIYHDIKNTFFFIMSILQEPHLEGL